MKNQVLMQPEGVDFTPYHGQKLYANTIKETTFHISFCLYLIHSYLYEKVGPLIARLYTSPKHYLLPLQHQQYIGFVYKIMCHSLFSEVLKGINRYIIRIPLNSQLIVLATTFTYQVEIRRFLVRLQQYTIMGLLKCESFRSYSLNPLKIEQLLLLY